MRYRHRETSPLSIRCGFKVFYGYQGTFYPYSDYTTGRTLLGGFEEIYDEPHGKYSQNPTLHTSFSESLVGQVKTVQLPDFWGPDYPFKLELHPGYRSPPTVPAVSPDIGPLLDDIETQLRSTLGKGLDLAAAVIELPQFALPLNLLKLFGKRTGRALNSASGDFLSTKYGILPTISDVAALLKFRSVYEQFLTRLHANGGNAVLRARLSESKSESTGGKNEPHYRSTYTVRQFARLPVRIDQSKLNLSTVDAFIDYSGLNRPLETIWELVPFSFVVDWFASVGDVIQQVQNSLIEKSWIPTGPLTITSVAEGESEVDDYLAAGAFLGPGYLPVEVRTDGVRRSSKRYWRQVLPYTHSTFTGLEFPMSASNHILEIAALIAQKIK